MRKPMILIAVAALLIGTVALVWSDNDHDKGRHGRNSHDKHEEHGRNGKGGSGWFENDDAVPPVNDQAYLDACGSCHFAYQPALLPARSWQALLDGADDHFGESLSFSPEEREAVVGYLTANAAESSGCEIGDDIVHSLGNTTPLRITEIPEIRHEHRKISAATFQLEAVGGFQNCPACHTGAEQGDYDHPRIPK